jgi:hypothetical protein
MGGEQLYDLASDPFEMVNLVGSSQGDRLLPTLRGMLLRELTNNPGSIEVENAYLRPYRQWLKALVQQPSPPGAALSASRSPLVRKPN